MVGMHRLLLLLGLLLVAGCGGDEGGGGGLVKPRVSDLEASIGKDATASVGEPVTIECPDDAEAKPGARFECAMTAEDGTKATATVVIKSVDLDRDPPLQAD